MSSRARRWLLVGVVASIAVLVAGCDTVFFPTEKQVLNSTSTGPFIVHFTCTNDHGTDSDNLTFNGPGTNLTYFGTSDTGPTTCTISEPTSAGATKVTILCDTPPSGATCTTVSGGLQVVLDAGFGSSEPEAVPIKVVNDFAVQGAPDPPFNVTAELGSVIVRWTPPAYVGVSGITSYIVTASDGETFTVDGSQSMLEIPCMAPNITYTFTVVAVNAYAQSVASGASNPVTPTEACDGSVVATVPRAVTAVPRTTG